MELFCLRRQALAPKALLGVDPSRDVELPCGSIVLGRPNV